MEHSMLMAVCVIAGIFLGVDGIQILSKSKLEKCEKTSDSGNLNCSTKVVLNLAVPSGSSGGEASIVAEIVEVEDNSSSNMQTVRIPPVITVNKSAAYALYDLTYIRDVPYKPQEYHATTRKCEPDAGPDIVQICERLRDDKGNVLEQTQPTCCPCGPQRRMPSSCGDIFDKIIKGKANTAHCLRFPGDWFHVFGIGQRSLGFSIRVELKTGTRVSEVIIGPENRTATANDNFLKVNLIGDFGGYTNIPSFEDLYLVIPRETAAEGQPGNLGRNYSMWMLLERVRFTLDGLECNKIGVGYEAFNTQPNFCSSPYWSCLHNQLWNFREFLKLAVAPASDEAVQNHFETVIVQEEGCCVICMDTIQVGSDVPVGRMPCSHVFHRTCGEDWLRNSAICPICRAVFPSYVSTQKQG